VEESGRSIGAVYPDVEPKEAPGHGGTRYVTAVRIGSRAVAAEVRTIWGPSPRPNG